MHIISAADFSLFCRQNSLILLEILLAEFIQAYKWHLRNEHTNSILITRHHPDLGSYASSEWNFCARFSDVIWQGNQWWRRQMSAVFSGYSQSSERYLLFYCSLSKFSCSNGWWRLGGWSWWARAANLWRSKLLSLRLEFHKALSRSSRLKLHHG